MEKIWMASAAPSVVIFIIFIRGLVFAIPKNFQLTIAFRLQLGAHGNFDRPCHAVAVEEPPVSGLEGHGRRAFD